MAPTKSSPKEQSKLRQDFVTQSEYNKQKEKWNSLNATKTANITKTNGNYNSTYQLIDLADSEREFRREKKKTKKQKTKHN